MKKNLLLLSSICFMVYSNGQLLANIKKSNIQIEAEKLLEGDKACKDKMRYVSGKRFVKNETNNFYLDVFDKDSETQKHIDATVSIGYYLTNPISSQCNDYWDLLFTYTGEFDFYLGTRDSGPVIGRRYNPGLMYTYSFDKPDGFTQLFVTVEHESNGQSTTDTPSLLALANRIERKYSNDDSVTRSIAFDMAQETVSRGWDFYSIGTQYRIDTSGSETINTNNCNTRLDCFDFYFKTRKLFKDPGIEDQIFWLSNVEDLGIDAYAGTTITFDNSFGEEEGIPQQGFEFTIRTGEIGKHFGDHITYDLTYYINWDLSSLILPISMTYHNGYLEELYMYSDKTEIFKVGLHLRF